jgi:hypothetical protein
VNSACETCTPKSSEAPQHQTHRQASHLSWGTRQEIQLAQLAKEVRLRLEGLKAFAAQNEIVPKVRLCALSMRQCNSQPVQTSRANLLRMNEGGWVAYRPRCSGQRRLRATGWRPSWFAELCISSPSLRLSIVRLAAHHGNQRVSKCPTDSRAGKRWCDACVVLRDYYSEQAGKGAGEHCKPIYLLGLSLPSPNCKRPLLIHVFCSHAPTHCHTARETPQTSKKMLSE